MLGHEPLDVVAPAPAAQLAHDLDDWLTDVGQVIASRGIAAGAV
jgi:hypothetical protein